MPARRVNPYRVKLHRIYSVQELAECLGVHKNTVRHWQGDGLQAIDGNRPTLFEGAIARAFLLARQTSRKRPCPPGTIYCFKCREPRLPALGMVEFIPGMGSTGNLMALCDACGTMMHRRANMAKIATIMPRLAVQIRPQSREAP
ncbi:helix-turn-helix domain-containing protein [Novosphingobium sp. FKTRR1]|uniref:helix-turn-helix domain-containing protein n=1 Tax=Novosphingobium sp. FKTRR1 TaxID=2879118 RepID=UPI001CEFB94B|nr:helix-turn-helix domain-containing protein [Novosphingobium sp. FKTRR1]